MSISYILSAVVALGVLIFVHELGHFLVAKRVGILVETFSLGFGPKLLRRRFGETEYVLSAVPLGGYVKMYGEEPGSLEAAAKEADAAGQQPQGAPPIDPARAFSTQSVGKRLSVVAAGPFFNFFLAVFVFVVVYLIGVPVLKPSVGEVRQDMPAAAAGVQPGDLIVALEGREVKSWDELTAVVRQKANVPVKFTIQRENRIFDLTITPTSRTDTNLFGEKEEVGIVGIVAGGDYFTQRYNPIAAIGKGFAETWKIISLTITAIVKIVQGVIPAKSIGGPILIFTTAGKVAEMGLLPYAQFVALISINLGILNLLPIPLLDGGHIFFFSIEALTGRPVSVRKREIAQQVGLAFLILLMLFAVFNDISRMIQ